jgi:hypothetical protein
MIFTPFFNTLSLTGSSFTKNLRPQQHKRNLGPHFYYGILFLIGPVKLSADMPFMRSIRVTSLQRMSWLVLNEVHAEEHTVGLMGGLVSMTLSISWNVQSLFNPSNLTSIGGSIESKHPRLRKRQEFLSLQLFGPNEGLPVNDEVIKPVLDYMVHAVSPCIQSGWIKTTLPRRLYSHLQLLQFCRIG